MKRTPRERLLYHGNGAKRDLDGHIWVAVIIIAVALLAYLVIGWGGVLAVAVLTIGGLLLTKFTGIDPIDPRSYQDVPADQREQAELNDEQVQYMSTNGRGCLLMIVIVFGVMVALMLIFFIGNQHF